MKRVVIAFAFIVLLLLVGVGSYYEAELMLNNADTLACAFQIRGC